MSAGSRPPSPARASMADVGRLAEVSAQTVSRYFTGTGYVSEATRARIEAAVVALGYRPNHAARNLRVRRSDTVGVLAVGPTNYGTWSIVAGLSAAARRAGFSLLIAHLDIDTELPSARAEVRTALDRFLSAQVDGIVLSTPYLGTEGLLDQIWETLPVVTISGHPWSSADSATADSYAAGLLATRHLIDLGHRRILHIAGPHNRNEAVDREQAYCDALAAAGLEPLPVARGDWTPESGHAVGLLADIAEFSAVFAGNDEMALGFLSAMRSRGLFAPAGYSIVGIDDMPDTQFFDPPLSSVRLDFTALGSTAFEMVLHRIRTGERLERRVIAPVLFVRDSSAPPPPTIV